MTHHLLTRLAPIALSSLCCACGGGGADDTVTNSDAFGNAHDATVAGTNAHVNSVAALKSGIKQTPAPAVTKSQGKVLNSSLGRINFLTTAATPLATFDVAGTDSIANWWYSDSAVPVSEKGTLTSVTGRTGGLGGNLDFDLGCGSPAWVATTGVVCGNAANMNTQFKAPVAVTPTAAISLDIRNPGATGLAEVAVTDSTGQKLAYRFDPRTIETPNPESWSSFHIPLLRTPNFYGGANDGVFHGPLKAVSVNMGTSGIQTPADNMNVDNVNLQANSDFVFALNPAAAPVPGTFASSYVGRLAVSTHQYVPQSFVKAKEVGITIVRRDLKWTDVEAKGVYNFKNYDLWTDWLGANGMSVLWILDTGHPDHGGPNAPISAPDQAAFAAFSGAAAQHYKGRSVAGYEVWNEPNYAAFWAPPDAQAYGALLGRTADAIKSHDSDAKVLSAGIAVSGIKMMTYMAQLAQTGNLAKVDGVAIHPYRPTKPESFVADGAPLANIFKANGVTAPLSVTEWGYPSYGNSITTPYGNGADPRALSYQAVLTLRMVLTQLTMNLPVMTIYDLVDDCVDALNKECNFGLLKPDLSDKPAMTALRTLYSVAQSRSFKGPLTGVPPAMHVMRWDGSSDKVFAIWVDTVGATGAISLPAKTKSVKRWDGTAVAFNANPNVTSVNLTESDGPVFVTVGN